MENITTARFALAVVVAAAAVAISSTVHGDFLKPIQAQKIDLGTFTGVAYYTVEQGDYRLVVTLQAVEDHATVRFVATLGPGQSATLSAPRSVGEPAVDAHFVRQGEQIVVNAVEPPRRVESE
jgi:hypothetical protein